MRNSTISSGVPVEPFRTRVEKLTAGGEITFADIAVWLGFVHAASGKPDTTRVQRLLGIRESKSGSQETAAKREYVSYKTAVKLCDALGLDYWEVGV